MSNEYSFSLTTFSPTGKMTQIEHALNAVYNNGKLAIGIKAKNGIVLLSQKKHANNILLEESSVRKIEKIANHIGCVYSGMPSDFRVILTKARKEAQAYYLIYHDPIPILQLVQKVASVIQDYTQSGGVRPFGVSILVCGCDYKGPQLYQLDPSGTYISLKAASIGKESLNAKSFLEKRYSPDIDVEDAIHTGLLTLKESSEGQIDETNIEIGVAKDKELFKTFSSFEIKDYLAEIE